MTKQMADKVIKKLDLLDEQVEQGKIKVENDMITVLADAEAVTAHNYIFKEGNTDENIIAPNLTVQHIDTLHLLLNHVNKLEKGAVKEKSNALLNENRELRKKMSTGNFNKNDVKTHLKNVREYLEKRQ